MSDVSPPRNDLIVIGGSAGSISVIRQILSELPTDLAAPILIVVHQAQLGGGGLADVLIHHGPARKGAVRDGEPPRPGHVYVAPPDHHLLVEPGHIRISHGPRENGFRPAIDALFRTAASAYGPGVTAVLLSGYLDDGAMGLLRVRQGGGVTIVQDPADAEVPDMPSNALRADRPDHVVPGAAIADLLTRLVGRSSDPAPLAPQRIEVMDATGPTAHQAPLEPQGTALALDRRGIDGQDTAAQGDDGLTRGQMPGALAGLSCPQCGGAIWETDEGRGMPTYRCHVGHRYSVESMRAAKDAEVETALWAALRALQERAALYWRLAEKSSRANAPTLAERYREHAEEAEERGRVIRRVVLGEPSHT